jgi:glycosyltransferase involved in cell wall biosynthesis
MAHRPNSDRQPVLLMGHFSPPLSGRSLAMDRLSDLLESQGPIVRFRTVPRRPLPRYLHHLCRIFLVSQAALQLARRRREASAVFLSVDAGFGMLYCIFLSLTARSFGYRTTLDHHSHVYVAHHSRLMAVLVAAAGRSSTHLFKCELVLAKFRRMYSLRSQAEVLGVAYAADTAPSPLGEANEPRPLVLGHLSNLSVDKGLADVITLALNAKQLGLAAKVVVAGPLTGRRERLLVDQGLRDGYLDYRGPVSGDEKEAFFGDVDVFLFPSRYRNELSPLVVWEALLRGVPIIGYSVGCLTSASAGSGSLILDPNDPFVEAGLRQLRTWREVPGVLSRARRHSREHAETERRKAVAEALSTGARLLSYHRA